MGVVDSAFAGQPHKRQIRLHGKQLKRLPHRIVDIVVLAISQIKPMTRFEVYSGPRAIPVGWMAFMMAGGNESAHVSAWTSTRS